MSRVKLNFDKKIEFYSLFFLTFYPVGIIIVMNLMSGLKSEYRSGKNENGKNLSLE